MDKHILIKIMFIALYDFCPSFEQHMYLPAEKGFVLGDDPVIDPFSEFGLCFKSPVFQAVLH